MNSNPTPRLIPLGDEPALELASAAASAERQNRPTLLLVLSALLLIGAGVYAVRSFWGVAAARVEIRDEQDKTRQLQDLAAQIKRISEGEKTELNEPDPGVVAKLEQLAKSLGLPERPKLVITQSDAPRTGQGVSKKRFTAEIKEAQSQSLLNWLVQATGVNDVGLSGLEVSQVKILPNKGQGAGVAWDASIILTRLERGS